MYYFIIRITHDGSLAFVVEGEGPAPPIPTDRPICHIIRITSDGEVHDTLATIEIMAAAIASQLKLDVESLVRPQVGPFNTRHALENWLLTYREDSRIDTLHQLLRIEQQKLRDAMRIGDELGVRRSVARIDMLEARIKQQN